MMTGFNTERIQVPKSHTQAPTMRKGDIQPKKSFRVTYIVSCLKQLYIPDSVYIKIYPHESICSICSEI